MQLPALLRRLGGPALSGLLAGCTSPAPLPPTAAPGAPAGDLAQQVEAAADHAPLGPEHGALARLAGDWTVAVEAPDGSVLGTGSARGTLRHGGRFVELAVQLDLSGVATTATGLFGYDAAARRTTALWLSDLSDAMVLLEGTGTLEGGLTLRGRQAGVEGRSRMRLRGDELVVESLAVRPDGAEELLRRTRYRRVTR